MPTLSQLTEVMIKDRKAITSSLNVAEVFNKQHAHVLRKIDHIKKDWNKAINSKELGSKMDAVNSNSLNPKMDAVLPLKIDAIKPRFKDHF